MGAILIITGKTCKGLFKYHTTPQSGEEYVQTVRLASYRRWED